MLEHFEKYDSQQLLWSAATCRRFKTYLSIVDQKGPREEKALGYGTSISPKLGQVPALQREFAVITLAWIGREFSR